VSTHVAKLKNLWIELNNTLAIKKNTFPELLLVSKILHALTSQFEIFRSSWMLLTKDNAKTLDMSL
jgi:hypothetical protein